MGMSIDAIKTKLDKCNIDSDTLIELTRYLERYQKIQEVMDSRLNDDAKSNSKALGEIEVIMYGNNN